MIRKTGLTAMLGIAALLVVGVGCRDGDAAAVEGGAESMSELAALAAVLPAATAAQAPSSGSGIWVSGHARVTVEPDLVLLTVGVEATADTVAEARAEAAGAMDAVVRAVKAHGLEDQDVQTRSFNIWPQYEYPEVTSGGTRTRRQVLVGYTVSNMAGIKIRDVDAVGAIIEDVAEAGGDKTRIDGVNFSVEDPEPFMAQLRQEAVRDAVAKADHFASLTGVAVGDLVSIGEVGAGTPVVRSFGFEEALMTRTAAAPATSISGGELELRLSVQAVFSIQ